MVKNEIAHEGVLLVIEIVGYQSVRLPSAVNKIFITEIIFQIGIVVRETRLDSDFVPFTGIVGAGREKPTGIGRSITVVSHRIKQIVVLAQVARLIEVAAQVGIHGDVMLGVVEVVLVVDVAPIRTRIVPRRVGGMDGRSSVEDILINVVVVEIEVSREVDVQ